MPSRRPMGSVAGAWLRPIRPLRYGGLLWEANFAAALGLNTEVGDVGEHGVERIALTDDVTIPCALLVVATLEAEFISFTLELLQMAVLDEEPDIATCLDVALSDAYLDGVTSGRLSASLDDVRVGQTVHFDDVTVVGLKATLADEFSSIGRVLREGITDQGATLSVLRAVLWGGPLATVE